MQLRHAADVAGPCPPPDVDLLASRLQLSSANLVNGRPHQLSLTTNAIMPDLHCSFAVLGTTDNPWADMHVLLHAQMYPPFRRGFTARVAVLVVLLVLWVLPLT